MRFIIVIVVVVVIIVVVIVVVIIVIVVSQEMENKIRGTLNEIYFGKTRDIVNDLR